MNSSFNQQQILFETELVWQTKMVFVSPQFTITNGRPKQEDRDGQQRIEFSSCNFKVETRRTFFLPSCISSVFIVPLPNSLRSKERVQTPNRLLFLFLQKPQGRNREIQPRKGRRSLRGTVVISSPHHFPSFNPTANPSLSASWNSGSRSYYVLKI